MQPGAPAPGAAGLQGCMVAGLQGRHLQLLLRGLSRRGLQRTQLVGEATRLLEALLREGVVHLVRGRGWG